MKRMKSGIDASSAALRAAAALFLLVLFGADGICAYEREETLQKSLPLQGAKRIIVSNSRGDIKVIGEKGRSDIFCEYTKRIHGRDRDEADRLFDLMDIEVTREGTGLKISARYPDRSERNRSLLAMLVRRYAGLSIDLIIAVPPELGVEIVSASGDIELASVLGAAMITSASGDVEAVDIGDLKVDVSSGDLTVSGVTGTAALSSSSGSIEAHKIKGNLSVRSSSGDVVLSKIDGDLSVETAMGDVEVDGVRSVDYSGTSGSARFTGVRGAVTAIAASGDIEVDAAPESIVNYEMRTSSGRLALAFERVLKSGFVLKVRTTSGDISTNLPITVTKVGRHYLVGVVREGKSIVVLETASGDIEVSEPEE